MEVMSQAKPKRWQEWGPQMAEAFAQAQREAQRAVERKMRALVKAERERFLEKQRRLEESLGFND